MTALERIQRGMDIATAAKLRELAEALEQDQAFVFDISLEKGRSDWVPIKAEVAGERVLTVRYWETRVGH